MTASQKNPSYECGEGMKVKVVKWCGKNFQIQCFYNGTSGALCQKTQKLEKLKRKLLKILTRYDLSRVVPCERARPGHSKNVVVFEI